MWDHTPPSGRVTITSELRGSHVLFVAHGCELAPPSHSCATLRTGVWPPAMGIPRDRRRASCAASATLPFYVAAVGERPLVDRLRRFNVPQWLAFRRNSATARVAQPRREYM